MVYGALVLPVVDINLTAEGFMVKGQIEHCDYAWEPEGPVDFTLYDAEANEICTLMLNLPGFEVEDGTLTVEQPIMVRFEE